MQTEQFKPNFLGHVESLRDGSAILGCAELRDYLHHHTKVTGPEKRGAIEWIQPSDIIEQVSDAHVSNEALQEISNYIAGMYNKIASRTGNAVSPSVSIDIARTIDSVLPAAEYPQSQTGLIGLSRLIARETADHALHYLSDEFVEELQDTANGDPEMEKAIGNYFSVKELLRNAFITTEPMLAAKQAVSAACEIAKDPKGFLKEVVDPQTAEIAEPMLTPAKILMFTTRYPDGHKRAIRESAELYRALSEEFPLVAQYDPSCIASFSRMRGRSEASLATLRHQLATIESAVSKALQDGYSTDYIRYIIKYQGDVVKADGAYNRNQSLRPGDDKRRSQDPHSIGERAYRTKQKNVIPGELFSATKYGRDFRDVIFNLSDLYDENNSEDLDAIFETVTDLLRCSKEFGQWFHGYDAELSEAVEKSLNERVADVLYAIEAIARDGTLTSDVAPHRHMDNYTHSDRYKLQVSSLREAASIIGALNESFSTLHNVMTSADTMVHRAVQENSQFMTYRFSSQEYGEALLYIRPEGAKGYDPQMEYGNKQGVEASIKFIVNPSDPHRLHVYKDPHGLSIRFDREGRTVDESAFSDDRDPTRDDGLISLDISALAGDGRTTPVKVGRFIAAGNILRAAKIGGEESFHHINKHFNQQKYGSREGFAKLAVYIAHMAETMIAIQQHGTHASRYQSIPVAQRRAS